MADEMNSIQRNGTWQLVDRPTGKKIIGLKWIFKTKFQANGDVLKHKARIVAKGYIQQLGVDVEEVYAPVAHMETVPFLFALAAQRGWEPYHLDVKSAFLNGEITEEVFVEQPVGFQIQGKEDMVYKLYKALYGLKQASLAWYSKIDSYFLLQGFKRSENEPTLYMKIEETGDIILVCIYVDDIVCLSSSVDLITKFKYQMKSDFEMTDLGLLTYFLGIEVTQDDNGVFISQRKYTQDLLKKYNMLSCKPSPTPMCTNEKFTRDNGSGDAEGEKYRCLMGKLIYLTHTRPDISYSVGVLSRFMNIPSRFHAGACK